MKFFIFAILPLVSIAYAIRTTAGFHPSHSPTVSFDSRSSFIPSNKPIPTGETPWPTTRHSRQSFSTISATISISEKTDDNHHGHHQSSGVCSNRLNCIEGIIAIAVLSVVLIFVVFAVKSFCYDDKKTMNNSESLTNKSQRLVVENKVYISTISRNREEAPPTYADVHRVW